MAKVIMHLDMDAFFVNVELLQKPELRGQKIIVARESERSVVLSASYEARQLGVGSAMPLAVAKRKCPDAIVVEPSAQYREYSKQVMGILRGLTHRVEQVSVDEAFVDLTGTQRSLGNPLHVAQKVREQIQNQLSLPSSAGIASTKFVAKMASSGSKPNGLWVVPPHRVQEFLDPLPVGKLWGVGPKSAATIEGLGIHTVAQLRELELDYLRSKFGRHAGEHLYRMCRGIDLREVEPYRLEKSMGAEHTFAQDTVDFQRVSREVFTLCLGVASRLRAAGKYTRSISLKIRFEGFETITRSCTLKTPTDSGQVLFRAVLARLDELGVMVRLSDVEARVPRPIRLLGIRAEKLEDRSGGFQETLLNEDLSPHTADHHQNWYAVESAMDTIQQKFGVRGLVPARLLPATREGAQHPDEK